MRPPVNPRVDGASMTGLLMFSGALLGYLGGQMTPFWALIQGIIGATFFLMRFASDARD